MWTYKTPYRPAEFSGNYIQRRGEVALSRALNINRLVVFAGSGLSAAYGQISWGDLVSAAVKAALPEPGEVSWQTGAQRAVKQTLDRIENDGSGSSGSKTSLLEVAEEAARQFGRQDLFRSILAGEFGRPPEELKKTVQGKLENSIKPIETSFQEIYSSAKRHDKLVGPDKSRCDPIRYLIDRLDINRFITLNYDVEIERCFHDLFRSSGQGASGRKSDFDLLCRGTSGDGFANLGNRVEYRDGTSRSVSSVCLSGHNVGDLISFSMFPSQYVAQVFHLHGRCDKPESLVLTEADYQRTYFKNDQRRQAFDESFSNLFSGNDVLFVGLGMQEQEVLVPLRKFMSDEAAPDFAKRHVFSLLPRQVTLDDSFLRTSRDSEDRDELIQIFKAKHFDLSPCESQTAKEWLTEKHPKRFTSTFSADKAADEQQQLELKSRYGVYTLLYGNEDFRTYLLTVLTLRSCLVDHKEDHYPASIQNFETDDAWLLPEHKGFVPARLVAALHACLDRLNDRKAAPQKRALLTKTEQEDFISLVKAAIITLGTSKALPHELGPLLDAISNRLYSLALERELDRIRTRRDRWWSDWRARPQERVAKFAAVDPSDDRPCYARHQAEYEAVPDDTSISQACMAGAKPSCFASVQDLREIAARQEIIEFDGTSQKVFENKRTSDFDIHTQRIGSRILRASMPRGQGKGSLLHLISQKVPTSECKALFGDDCGHIKHKYLDTLFEQDINFRYASSFVLHLSYSMEFSSVITALSRFFEDQILNALVSRRGELKRIGCENVITFDRINSVFEGDASFRELLLGFQRAICGVSVEADSSCDEARKKLSEALEVFYNRLTPLHGAGRVHRLERLRARLRIYTFLADALPNDNLRIFIAMSGLDKLCDNDGVAYNPMYRAFFRILTGCGQKYKHETDIMIPVDFFFLSGTETPLRYLSEEITKDCVERKLQRNSPFSGRYAAYLKYRRLPDGMYAQNWPIVRGIDLTERYWLKDKLTEKLLQPAQSNDDTWLSDQNLGALRKEWETSVAVHSWCVGAWNARRRVGDLKDLTEIGLNERCTETLSHLDGAASRSGAMELVEAVLADHRRTLRLVPKSAVESGDCWRTTSGEPVGNELTELLYVVLSQLALFPMPVERNVIYGCPLVKKVLARLPGGDADPSRLRILGQLLDYMQKARLVICVKRKAADAELDNEGLHKRYIIQHQLRDIASKEMDLSVPDQGEHNYFQVSIYPDQPRDLPTPRQDHYEMVRDIFDGQILKIRNSLWCLFQLTELCVGGTSTQKLERLSSVNRELLDSGLNRRFLKKVDGNLQLDTDLAELHAIGHRIRALYGMLRTGFTVGTISRLAGFEDAPEPDQPYERFRGWLRALTNAATGLDYCERTICILTGRFEGEIARTNLEKVKQSLLEIDVYLSGSDDVSKIKSVVGAIMLPQTEPENGASEQVRKDALFSALQSERKNSLFPPKPLYRDEIGWILNERGLLSLVQGHVFDAMPLFNQALNVMYHQGKEAGNDPALHAAVRRVRFNRALTLILRGHLKRARAELRALVLPTDLGSHAGSLISWLSQSYIHLCNFYSGNLTNVEQGFQSVLEQANSKGIFRLSSIFNRHLANYYLRMEETEIAREHLQLAIGAAEQSEQRDVLHLAYVNLARLIALEKKTIPDTSSRYLSEALQYGRQMGFPRLEALAHRTQAELQLVINDTDAAGQNASIAAAIASRCGLRLDKLQALATLSDAHIRRGNADLATNLLDPLSRDAQRHDFQLMAARIRKLKRVAEAV